jgi:hypothetical protein
MCVMTASMTVPGLGFKQSGEQWLARMPTWEAGPQMAFPVCPWFAQAAGVPEDKYKLQQMRVGDYQVMICRISVESAMLVFQFGLGKCMQVATSYVLFITFNANISCNRPPPQP